MRSLAWFFGLCIGQWCESLFLAWNNSCKPETPPARPISQKKIRTRKPIQLCGILQRIIDK